MKRKRHTPDEVISEQRDVDAPLSNGGTIDGPSGIAQLLICPRTRS